MGRGRGEDVVGWGGSCPRGLSQWGSGWRGLLGKYFKQANKATKCTVFNCYAVLTKIQSELAYFLPVLFLFDFQKVIRSCIYCIYVLFAKTIQ